MRLVMLVLLICGMVFTGCMNGCGPKAPEIATTIQQSFGAANMSVLSQVDWKTVATTLAGKVGPRTRLLLEAYTKTSAGVEILIDGAEMSINTQAAGTGGRDNSAMVPELMEVQQRWERASDADRVDKNRWTQQVIDALVKSDARQKSPTTLPAQQGEKSAE